MATLVARAVPPEEVFAAVTAEAGRLLTVDVAVLTRYDPDGTEIVLGAWAGTGAPPGRDRGRQRAGPAELAASRARIVAVGDAGRRRIERNLHDGAQQRPVTLVLQLREAQAAAGTGELAQRLEGAVTEVAGVES